MSLFKVFRKELTWGGKPLILETGKIARQASSVVVRYGGTTVLCNAVASKDVKEGQDFFPLKVDYQEKAFAAGRIPGGFFRREGKPSEHETLVSRLIDRPIRPLFPEKFYNEVQIIATVLEFDQENMADIPAIIGASAALTLSGVPFFGPVAAARVGMVDGEFVLNPTLDQIENGDLDLIVAGTSEGVLMVESEAQELTEEKMLEAVMFGHKAFQEVIEAIVQMAEHCAKDPWDLVEESAEEKAFKETVRKAAADGLVKAYSIVEKQARQDAVKKVKEETVAKLKSETITEEKILSVFKGIESDVVRSNLIKTKKRIDGRGTTDIRPIEVEVGILPRTHGSALFTRGETQALVVATLGSSDDEQIIDALEGESRRHFLLHYNFPPYSVGEVGRVGSPGRREVGHGKLAWRAINPLMPKKEDFAYTTRVVSEITESNGSSSMATVCGSSLALMDAGVPLPRPIAGIAMGLIKEDKDFVVLSDILGDEDHLGDMDFKVAGTEKGVTALQMDLKITSINEAIMKQALSQAKQGRLHILGEMAKAISSARGQVSSNAPRVYTMSVPKDKIREVIGTGGSVIRALVEETGTKIDIEDDGSIKVYATSEEQAQDAIKRIQDIVAVAEVGRVYKGTVMKTADFGAFVRFIGKTEGLVHISELENRRVAKVTDVVTEGKEVYVKCIGIDERGRVRLSMRVVDQETGAELEDTRKKSDNNDDNSNDEREAV